MQELIINSDEVKNLSKKLNEPPWLTDIRLHAFNSFKEFPELRFKYGSSLFTNVSELNLEEIDPVEGIAEEIKVSATKAKVITFENALNDEKYEKILKEYLMRDLLKTKIGSFNLAFWTKGLIIHIPSSVKDNIDIIRTMKSKISIGRIIVIAEPNSEVTVSEILESEIDAGLNSQIIEIILMENSKVKYEQLQNLNEKIWHFSDQKAIVAQNAEMKWFTTTIGGELSKINVVSDLIGEGADADNFSLFLGTGKQRFDIYNSSIHSFPNTTSNIKNKGMVKDFSKSTYRGLINIKEKARNSNGYQKQDTLMLDETSEANSVPNLEINNNDVKCSHGVTLGQIDEESIFYLMSRGLNREEAKKEIVLGFLEEMIEKVQTISLKEKVREILAKKIK